MKSIEPTLMKNKKAPIICPVCGGDLNYVFVDRVVVAFCGEVDFKVLDRVIDSIGCEAKEERLTLTCSNKLR